MNVIKLLTSTLLVSFFDIILGLNNGLARTPPMGWLSWERFRCNIDCKADPLNCISENLIVNMTDRMVLDGYLAAGYKYIIIDDCWAAKERTPKGKLVADPERFPHGIAWLSNYVHSQGLKFGIYADFGTLTCGGYPGSEYYLQIDADTFAEWNVDYLKLDGCYSDTEQFDVGYPLMGFWLNQTGRPIVYSCSWPAYMEPKIKPDYVKIANYCNLWRNYDDIDDSWESVKSIIKFYAEDKSNFTIVAGPGNFNDPDMLIIGNYGLSQDQQRAQMAIWCIMASPLIMSVDLRNIKPFSRSLLINPFVIKINQDPLGIQGRRILKMNNIEIWSKPILPKGDLAFVILNLGNSVPEKVSINISQLGLSNNTIQSKTKIPQDSKALKFVPSSPQNHTKHIIKRSNSKHKLESFNLLSSLSESQLSNEFESKNLYYKNLFKIYKEYQRKQIVLNDDSTSEYDPPHPAPLPRGYKLYDVFSNNSLDGVYFLNSTLNVIVNPGGVFFGRAVKL